MNKNIAIFTNKNILYLIKNVSSYTLPINDRIIDISNSKINLKHFDINININDVTIININVDKNNDLLNYYTIANHYGIKFNEINLFCVLNIDQM